MEVIGSDNTPKFPGDKCFDSWEFIKCPYCGRSSFGNRICQRCGTLMKREFSQLKNRGSVFLLVRYRCETCENGEIAEKEFMAHSETVRLRKPCPLAIGRAECSSNLWGYLCERYGVNPSEMGQLVFADPPELAEAYREPYPTTFHV